MKYTFDCGAACTMMFLQHHKIIKRYKEVLAGVKCEKKYGTDSINICRYLNSFGFDLQVYSWCNIEKEVKFAVDSGFPVIAPWFVSLPIFRPGGHWSIIVGVTKKEVIIRDPSQIRIRRMDKEDFVQSWFVHCMNEKIGITKEKFEKNPSSYVEPRVAILPKII